MTAPTLSGDRPVFRTVAPALLLTAALSALAVAGAVAAAPSSVRTPLAWGASAAALLLCAAVALAAHSIQTVRLTRRRLEAVTLDAGRLLQERVRLTEESRREHDRLTGELARERTRLTAELDWERTRITESASKERAQLTESFAEERERLTASLGEERAQLTASLAEERERLTKSFAEERTQLTDERDRLAGENSRLTVQLRRATSERTAAVSATANAAGRMQALSTGMLADLRTMEERHSDEEVLADLLHLDHRTAQAGRLADSVAVLTGARSGRRWARPIVMESILRGAMGRISGYQRVRVHSASEAAVAGHAAEGVMHALAELLDNAANFSPPTAEVHVYVEEVPAGVIVSVEDSGLVMGEVQLRRAEEAVSGESAGIGGLTGTRLGLGVVGRLARKYGLKVSFRPSARGGTGVLMLLPQDILTNPAAAEAPATLPSPPAKASAEQSKPPAEQSRPRATPAPADSATGPDPDPVRPHDSADPEPVPRHDSTDPDPLPVRASADRASDRASADRAAVDRAADERPSGLPKRRRGRTLAEAERRLGSAGTTEPRPAPAVDDAKTRATRFNSFRQAVRAAAPDQTDPQPAAASDRIGALPDPAAPDRDAPDRDGGPPDATATAPEAAETTEATEATADVPSHQHAHPEGDPTS
ncbi:signal transduction histidine kinase [Streptomyces sp. LBL]|uniref:ATP-binding protein n=1 Tax=Streptomyces sp. LBL TaxID=2940562 RepID=UPI002473EE34|nr:ATP-binding protein [Streptomyces sp. LBL]MDH6628928.1 signal transduction histidine kinase [Streptomyces sp. LBL]